MENQLSGPADNAFNRERLAVKKHAEDTSGASHVELALSTGLVVCVGVMSEEDESLTRSSVL